MWLGPAWLPSRPSFVMAREDAVLFDSPHLSTSNGLARRGEIFLTQDSVQVIDGFSMIRVDCGALEARFLRPCLSSDLPVSRSDLLIVDLDSAHVRSLSRRKKHLQGWSLLNRHLDPMSLESKLRVASRAKESDSSNATTKVEHVPCEPSLLANTRLVLASMGMSPVENFAEAYCWWHALKGLAKIPFLELFLPVIDQSFGLSPNVYL